MDICELSVNGNSNRKGFIFPMNNQWRAFLCIVCNWLTLNLCQIQPDLVVHFEHLAKQKCKHANVVSIPKACVLWVKFTPPKSNIDTKKWWFGKCISFQNTAILAIYVQFQGGGITFIMARWFSAFSPTGKTSPCVVPPGVSPPAGMSQCSDNKDFTKRSCYELCSSPRKNTWGVWMRYVYI